MVKIVGEVNLAKKDEHSVTNNSIFIDVADDKLKFKDNLGDVREVGKDPFGGNASIQTFSQFPIPRGNLRRGFIVNKVLHSCMVLYYKNIPHSHSGYRWIECQGTRPITLVYDEGGHYYTGGFIAIKGEENYSFLERQYSYGEQTANISGVLYWDGEVPEESVTILGTKKGDEVTNPETDFDSATDASADEKSKVLKNSFDSLLTGNLSEQGIFYYTGFKCKAPVHSRQVVVVDFWNRSTSSWDEGPWRGGVRNEAATNGALLTGKVLTVFNNLSNYIDSSGEFFTRYSATAAPWSDFTQMNTIEEIRIWRGYPNPQD